MAVALMPDEPLRPMRRPKATPSKRRTSVVRPVTIEPAWTAEDVAAYLGISVRKLRDLPVPRRYVGRKPRYEPDRVKAWLAEGGDTRPRRRTTGKGGR